MKIIKIKDEAKKFLKPLIRSVRVAQEGVVLSQEIYSKAQKDLWEALHEEYPETVSRRASFDHPEEGDWEITLYGKRKTLRELALDAKALEERMKILDKTIDEKSEELANMVTKPEPEPEPEPQPMPEPEPEPEMEKSDEKSGNIATEANLSNPPD